MGYEDNALANVITFDIWNSYDSSIKSYVSTIDDAWFKGNEKS